MGGGILYCEAETGAWDSKGIFRCPDERFPATASGVEEIGRRQIPKNPVFSAKVAGKTYRLKASHLLSPWRVSKGEVWATSAEAGGALLAQVKLGKGRFMLCGTYLGDEYDKECYPDFENLMLKFVEEAGADLGRIRIAARTKLDFDSYVHVRYGRSQGKDVAFVFFPAGCNAATLTFRKDIFTSLSVKDIVSGKQLVLKKAGGARTLRLLAGRSRMAILVEGK